MSEIVVADIQSAVHSVLKHAVGLQRGQEGSRADRGDHADHGRGRQQPASSGSVEAAQLHGAGGAHLAPEQPGDQEARDDEEHVHADEPTTHTRQASVEEDNGHDGDSTQAFDVRAKSRLYRALTLQSFDTATSG